MSDANSKPAARPVSLFTTLFILALFASFYFLVRHYYAPASSAPQNAAVDNLPKELAWRATSEARRAALKELREKEAAQTAAYGWVDQKAGIVQLPIERAMELTAAQYAKKK
jgi:hypothetical protein